MSKIRKKRKFGPVPRTVAQPEKPRPDYLGSPHVPLREAIRWAQRELDECPGDELDRKLAAMGDIVVARLCKMVGSENDKVATEAVDAFCRLRRMGTEREAARLGMMAKGIEASVTESVGRMQAEVERGPTGDGGNQAMLLSEMLPRVRAMMAEMMAAAGIKVDAQSAAGDRTPPPA